MANHKCSTSLFFYAFQLLLLLQKKALSFQYKVGDLDGWGLPTSAKPHVYTNWPQNITFKIGDSLLFLYPPSQDSVIQVSEQSFRSCNLQNPILYMDNGNSLFNITAPGEFYFTSGVPGHCDKSQKLQISVFSGNGTAVPSANASAMSASAPSYPTVFGPIPSPPSSSPAKGFSVFLLVAATGLALLQLNGGSM